MNNDTPLVIDTTFNMYSDTPEGGDPDAKSPTLRRCQLVLRSLAENASAETTGP